MVIEIIFIVYFTAVASHFVPEPVLPDKKFDDIQAAVFSRRAYPNPGDIPVLNRKVFRGTRVTISEHPYVASIRRLHCHYVTGAILSVHTVITVAHPVYNVSPTELGVVAGETYCDRGAAYMTVLLVVTHQNFDPYTLQSDLAILRVYEAIFAKPSQKPIALFTEFRDRPGGGRRHKGKQFPQQAFVTGWGRCDWTGKELCLPRSSVFYPDEKLDPMLRSISFNHSHLLQSPYCVGYEKHMIPLYLTSGMLCVGPAREVEPLAQCLAAPGAPLTVLGTLAGLLSWGFGCGYSHDLPLIYTDLRFHTGWIRNNLGILNNLNSDELSELYIAAKAYVMQEWLVLTSEQRPAPILHHEVQLRPADIDDHLIELSGYITDFRDYAYGGIFKDQKAQLYEYLRTESDKKKLYEDISSELLLKKQRGRPFLDKNFYFEFIGRNGTQPIHKHTNNAK